MAEKGIDLVAEIAWVRDELVAFRDVCLPAFFAPDGIPDRAWRGDQGPPGLRLHEWVGTADTLLDALPAGGHSGRLDLDDYSFLHQKTEPAFGIEGGRIVWRCELYVPIYSADRIESILGLVGEEAGSFGDPRRDPIGRLPQIERWLFGLAVDDPPAWNAVCTVVPCLVDGCPEFVLRALDPETWRKAVLEAPGLTLEERAGKLAFIDGPIFSHVLNNALLHVLGAAANNRFRLILELLDHRNILGIGYTRLFPHYILAVLLAKVRTLRGLAGVDDVPRGEGPRPVIGDGHGETGGGRAS